MFFNKHFELLFQISFSFTTVSLFTAMNKHRHYSILPCDSFFFFTISATSDGCATIYCAYRTAAGCRQKEEFETFNGPILMTTNCIVPPKDSYKDRLYTTGAAGYPGCTYINGGIGGKKDFSVIIQHAKGCEPPTGIEQGQIVGGFAHAQVLALADKVVDAVKSGKIRKFVVMAGCDGRAKSRTYYTDFAKALPESS